MNKKIINNFDGYYGFLSNFHSCKVNYKGIAYNHTEGAFQAQKTLCEEDRKYIATLSPGQSKRACGREGLSNFRILLREDWEQVKDEVMFDVVLEKFSSNTDLKEKLLATEDTELIEGNRWHDNYWGNCTCSKCLDVTGQNQLGKTLMKVRDILRDK